MKTVFYLHRIIMYMDCGSNNTYIQEGECTEGYRFRNDEQDINY